MIRIIRNAENKGFGAGCNQGYHLSTSKYVLLLNPDTKLMPGAILKSKEFMDSNIHISVLGVKHKDENGKVQPSISRFPSVKDFLILSLGLDKVAPRFFRSPLLVMDYDYETPGQVDQVMGAFMFVRTDFVQQLNTFMDERFFVYYDDLDFSKRVSLSGGISFYEPSIEIYHKMNGTTESIKGVRLFYSLDSRLKYIRKYFGKGSSIILYSAALIIEPFTRIVNVLVKKKSPEVREILQGYGLMYRKLIKSKLD